MELNLTETLGENRYLAAMERGSEILSRSTTATVNFSEGPVERLQSCDDTSIQRFYSSKSFALVYRNQRTHSL